jgi:hypothetical protein
VHCFLNVSLDEGVLIQSQTLGLGWLILEQAHEKANSVPAWGWRDNGERESARREAKLNLMGFDQGTVPSQIGLPQLAAGTRQLIASQALAASFGAKIDQEERTRLVTAVLIPQNTVEVKMQERFLRAADVRLSEEGDEYDFTAVTRNTTSVDVENFFNFLEEHAEWVRPIQQKSGCSYVAATCL